MLCLHFLSVNWMLAIVIHDLQWKQKHSRSYSKANVVLNDNAIWLIGPIVITAISIIYWAEWAGNEVQHYYELKQGSFIHLIVIPLRTTVANAKPMLNLLTYILYGLIQYKAPATHRAFWDLSLAVWGRNGNFDVCSLFKWVGFSFFFFLSHKVWMTAKSPPPQKCLNFKSTFIVH